MKSKYLKIVPFILMPVMISSIMGSCAGKNDIENNTVQNWIAWEWPDDKAAFGTAIDASFILDAPAGKHGFAYPKGEDIFFEDGTKARFWGTNVVMNANFLEKSEAEKLADRIARSGFNIVRFHHMDFGTSDNIFTSGTSMKTTKVLDPGQLDNMFYFMYLLKERGIYYYVDLLVSRQALESDGIIDAGDLSQGWKAHSLFDPVLINLQKEYARQLLTTVNPYTGLALIDDPAMVFIDILNENSLFVIDANRIKSNYYNNQLKQKFSQWLREKYATNEELGKAWEEAGKVGLRDFEDIGKNTVDIIGDGTIRIPDLYTKLNYSKKRKDDSYEFFFSVVRDFYIDMKSYLREIGVKCMITGTSIGGYPSTNYATMYLNKELMDYTDRHTYMSHPDKYFTVGSSAGSTDSLVRSGNNFFRNIAYRKVYNQPFVLGEWQMCQLNDYRAESELMVAAFSCFQNWNAIQFQMLSEDIPYNNKAIHTAFATYNDPAHTTTQPAAALIFHRNEIKEATEAYYFPHNKIDALNPDKNISNSSIYRYGKTGAMFTGFDDYKAEYSSKEALETLNNKAVKKETKLNDEMYWDSETFKINSDYTNAVMGFSPNIAHEFSNCIIKYNNPYAVISLTSVTDKPLAETGRMLLTAIARSRNTDFELSGNKIVKTGTAPVLAETVNAEITLKTDKDVSVYSLDSSGKRKEKLALEKDKNGFSKFEINGKYGSVYYEIIDEEFEQ